jgi:hypothetical protein
MSDPNKIVPVCRPWTYLLTYYYTAPRKRRRGEGMEYKWVKREVNFLHINLEG